MITSNFSLIVTPDNKSPLFLLSVIFPSCIVSKLRLNPFNISEYRDKLLLLLISTSFKYRKFCDKIL